MNNPTRTRRKSRRPLPPIATARPVQAAEPLAEWKVHVVKPDCKPKIPDPPADSSPAIGAVGIVLISGLVLGVVLLFGGLLVVGVLPIIALGAIIKLMDGGGHR